MKKGLAGSGNLVRNYGRKSVESHATVEGKIFVTFFEWVRLEDRYMDHGWPRGGSRDRS